VGVVVLHTFLLNAPIHSSPSSVCLRKKAVYIQHGSTDGGMTEQLVDITE